MTVLHSLPTGFLSGLDRQAALDELLEELYYAGAFSDQQSAFSKPDKLTAESEGRRPERADS